MLDPAAGTGSYLVEVARRIHQTLTEQGHGSLAAARVKRALRTRIFGFEILPAPYVVAHLQLGVFLRSLGASLTGRERFEVFLTNALTGWDPPKEPKTHAALPRAGRGGRTGEHRQAEPADSGDPGQSARTTVSPEWHRRRKRTCSSRISRAWSEYDVQVRGLNDLYVRFYRLAERRIADVGKRGIVCFISNFSWLDGQSHPVMRKRFLDAFDQIWIDNCNGDKYRTGKRTPDGKPDQSMFTTDTQPIGIQVGTAIATMVKTGRQHADGETGGREGIATCGDWAMTSGRNCWNRWRTMRTNFADTRFCEPSRDTAIHFTPGRNIADYVGVATLGEFVRGVDIRVFKTSRDEFG